MLKQQNPFEILGKLKVSSADGKVLLYSYNVGTSITPAEARELASSLMAQADKVQHIKQTIAVEKLPENSIGTSKADQIFDSFHAITGYKTGA